MVNWKTSGGSCPEPRREGSSDVQKQRCRGQGGGSERTFEWRLTSRGETVSEEDRLKIGRADDRHSLTGSRSQGAPWQDQEQKASDPSLPEGAEHHQQGTPRAHPSASAPAGVTGARQDTSSYSN